jgi:hypothetical protein
MKTLIAAGVLVANVFAGADTILLQPQEEGKDTLVYEFYPTWNYGTAVDTYVGEILEGADTRTLIEWDLSVLPEDAEINSGIMELYCFGFQGELVGSIVLFKITEEWDEMTATWILQPQYDTTFSFYGDWPATDEWAEFDITEYVQDWYESDNFGTVLNGTEVGCYAKFWTSDYYEYDKDLCPKLTIDYTPGDAYVTPSSLGAVKAVYR